MRETPPPATHWDHLSESAHFVQFYEDAPSLVDALRGFVATALKRGDAAIVIATPEHLQALEHALLNDDVDLPAARRSTQYLPLDAALALPQILTNGWPDPKLFESRIGSLISSAREKFGRVRAFGEMVSLLWENGRYGAAIRLEELWSELGKREQFALFCAYALADWQGGSSKAERERVCAGHSQMIVDGERYVAIGDPGVRSQALADLEHRARHWERELAGRRFLERRLAQREQELAEFLDNAVIGLHNVDRQGIILWANKAELDLLGYCADEYVGHHFEEFHVDAERAASLLTRLAAGQALHAEQVRLRCKDGSIKDALIDWTALFRNGELVHTRCSTRDITAQLRAERHLREEAEKWEILCRTGATLAGELDTERLMQTVADAAVALIEAQFGAFFYNVTKPAGGSHMLYALCGVPRESFESFPMPCGTASFEATFRGERVVRIDDIAEHPDYGKSPPHFGMPQGPLRLRSYLAVPVVSAAGGVHGGLFFGHSTPGRFTHRDELIVGGIAAQAAIAMDNARLFESSRRAQAELQQLNETLEQRVAERTAALRRSELQFQELVTGVVDYAIYMVDVDGYIVSWNTGAERIKGYSKTEAIGKNFSMFYTEEDRAKGAPQRALTIAATLGKYETEAWRVRKNGERFWASAVIDAVHDEQGKVVGFAKVTRDLTERRQIEEQLRHAQKMEAIGQLTGGVAHDFNNLLTVIVGNLETIWRLAPADDGKLRRAIDQTTRGAQRAVTLTQQLLAFSRRQPLNPKPTDINRLVGGMSDLIRRTIGENIAVGTVLAGGLWRVEIDAHQLESALLNLAVNARDAMPNGGKLTIETANSYLDEAYAARYPELTPGEYVAVCMTDTGTGMSAATLARAFEPFFTTKPVGHGTGLGLSQVYGFVKQSGGHVKLYSEVGQGTTVKLYLPRLLTPAQEEQETPAPIVMSGGRHEVILVVEDDDDVRMFTTESLSDLGFTVIEASDAPTALQMLERHPEVQLLFTDVGLPGLNGAQLVAEAKLRRPDVKVLFTTGYARNAIVHQGRLDPGVELLTKPFTRAQLASRVRDILDMPVPGEARVPVALVIEDEELVRMFVAEHLKDMGFAVIEAASATEGLAAARSHSRLDAVIVDRGLPDRDGLEVVSELRTQLPSLPVIVASGYAEGGEPTDLRDDARVRFLAKPFDTSALTAALAALNVDRSRE